MRPSLHISWEGRVAHHFFFVEFATNEGAPPLRSLQGGYTEQYFLTISFGN